MKIFGYTFGTRPVHPECIYSQIRPLIKPHLEAEHFVEYRRFELDSSFPPMQYESWLEILANFASEKITKLVPNETIVCSALIALCLNNDSTRRGSVLELWDKYASPEVWQNILSLSPKAAIEILRYLPKSKCYPLSSQKATAWAVEIAHSAWSEEDKKKNLVKIIEQTNDFSPGFYDIYFSLPLSLQEYIIQNIEGSSFERCLEIKLSENRKSAQEYLSNIDSSPRLPLSRPGGFLTELYLQGKDLKNFCMIAKQFSESDWRIFYRIIQNLPNEPNEFLKYVAVWTKHEKTDTGLSSFHKILYFLVSEDKITLWNNLLEQKIFDQDINCCFDFLTKEGLKNTILSKPLLITEWIHSFFKTQHNLKDKLYYILENISHKDLKILLPHFAEKNHANPTVLLTIYCLCGDLWQRKILSFLIKEHPSIIENWILSICDLSLFSFIRDSFTSNFSDVVGRVDSKYLKDLNDRSWDEADPKTKTWITTLLFPPFGKSKQDVALERLSQLLSRDDIYLTEKNMIIRKIKQNIISADNTWVPTLFEKTPLKAWKILFLHFECEIRDFYYRGSPDPLAMVIAGALDGHIEEIEEEGSSETPLYPTLHSHLNSGFISLPDLITALCQRCSAKNLAFCLYEIVKSFKKRNLKRAQLTFFLKKFKEAAVQTIEKQQSNWILQRYMCFFSITFIKETMKCSNELEVNFESIDLIEDLLATPLIDKWSQFPERRDCEFLEAKQAFNNPSLPIPISKLNWLYSRAGGEYEKIDI